MRGSAALTSKTRHVFPRAAPESRRWSWTRASFQLFWLAPFRLQCVPGGDDDENETLRFDIAWVGRSDIPDVHASSAQCSRDGPDGQASSQYGVQAVRAVECRDDVATLSDTRSPTGCVCLRAESPGLAGLVSQSRVRDETV